MGSNLFPMQAPPTGRTPGRPVCRLDVQNDLTTRKIKRPGGNAPPPGHGVKKAGGGGFSRFPLLASGEGESQWQPLDARQNQFPVVS